MNKLWMIVLLFIVVGCGGVEKCEHLNVKTVYAEGDWFALDKEVICEDCDESIENSSIQRLEYVYNRKLFNESGIALTIDKVTIDGWGSIVMHFTVEGTATSGRTISIENMYINDIAVNGMLYVSDIKDHKKSIEEVYLYDGIEAKDLLLNQDYLVELEYQITNSTSYEKLKSGSVSFNLNEYNILKEISE